MTTPQTELGLMQMLADADREAKENFAKWLADYKGKLAQPKAQPQLPPPSAPQEQVNYG